MVKFKYFKLNFIYMHVVKFLAWQIWVHFFYNSVVELEEI